MSCLKDGTTKGSGEVPVVIEIDHDRENRIHVSAPFHYNDLTKTIPGATWSNTYSRWTIPLSWTSCLACRNVFGSDLTIGPNLALWAKHERANRIDPAMALRDALDAPGDEDLYGYQRAGVEFLTTAERALLCDEMGCISGNAMITIERDDVLTRMSMRELFTYFHNPAPLDAPFRTASVFEDGSIALNTIVDVLSRGQKVVMKITTANNEFVQCTPDHHMATPDGWQQAGLLSVGDTLLIDGGEVATPSEITAIDVGGSHDVYDIVMSAPAHSYIVNTIVVHNSGKTITTIRAVKKLHDDGKDVFPMLVVCPNTMKRTWAKELAKWWPGISTVVVGGTAVQRRKQIESDVQAIIINWEGLRSHSRLAKYGSLALKRCQACGGSGTVKEAQCQTHERELNRIEFNTVIADELHRSKNPSSQVAMALRGASGNAAYRFGLTGTPISGNPVELWPLLHWVDEQEWPAKTKWVDRMVSYTYNVWGGMEVTGVRPDAEEEFHASINPRMRRMTKDIVLPFLPPKVFEQREVAFSGKQQKAYDQMEEDLVAKLDSGILLSANPMVQAGRLTQFASAYGDLEVQPDGSERLVLQEPSNKIDAFLADLEDFDGQAVVVFAQSKQLINLLSGALSKKGVRHGLITGDQDADQRQRTIEDFQSGDFNFVLCTIQAGGVGITLTRASVAVFLQRSWSPIDMQQAQDRVHRIGSEIHDSILIVDYVTPGTIEEAQIWALKHKRDLLQEIVRDADLMRKFLMGELGR